MWGYCLWDDFSLKKVTEGTKELDLTYAIFIEYSDEDGLACEPSVRRLWERICCEHN